MIKLKNISKLLVLLLIFLILPKFAKAARYFDQAEMATYSIPNSATGDTFYIDGINGSDTYNGLAPTFTSGTTGPFKTIGKCFDRYRSNNLVGGDVVKIKAGIYRGSIALQFTAPQVSSLTEAKPLEVGPYGDGEVIIDPSSTPQSWTAYDSNIFSADWPNATYSPQAVVMNNDFKSWRDKQALADLTTTGLWFFDVATRKIYVNTGGIDPLTLDPIITYNNVSAEQYAISTNGYPYLHFYGLTLRGAARYGFTDYPGSIGIKLENNTIKWNNGNGARIFGTRGVVRKNHIWGNMLYNWPRGRRWAANGGWGQGLTVGGYGLAEGNVVHDNGGEGMGVYGGTGHVVFQDNISYDNWSVGLYLDNAEYCTFQRNLVYSNNPSESDIVEDWQLPQWIIDAGTGTVSAETDKIRARQRQEGIMAGDEFATNPTAHSIGFKALNNIIIGARRGITTYGQAAGAGLNNYVFAGNTIVMPTVGSSYGDYAGIAIYASTNNANSVIKNNIIYGNTPIGPKPDYTVSALVKFGSNAAMSGVDFDSNLYFSENLAAPFKAGAYPSEALYNFAEWKNYLSSGYDADSIYANPLFTGTAGSFVATDYLLSLGSPAINVGANVLDIATDFNDFARSGLQDMGALEFGSIFGAQPGDTTAPSAPSNLSVL
ncbi:MAG: right-handed parallel beta-helix repeat-containing protein [bacterium]